MEYNEKELSLDKESIGLPDSYYAIEAELRRFEFIDVYDFINHDTRNSDKDISFSTNSSIISLHNRLSLIIDDYRNLGDSQSTDKMRLASNILVLIKKHKEKYDMYLRLQIKKDIVSKIDALSKISNNQILKSHIEKILSNSKYTSCVSSNEASNFILNYCAAKNYTIVDVLQYEQSVNQEETIEMKYEIINGKVNSYIGNPEYIKLPDGLTAIGSFFGKKGLKNITIPNSVISIDKYAFNDCKLIINIIIPNKVKCIKRYTFQNCENLSTVILPNDIETIEAGAFLGCNNLTSLILNGHNVLNTYKYAFKEPLLNSILTFVIGLIILLLAGWIIIAIARWLLDILIGFLTI